jgi:hypothetical protein
MRTLNGWLMGLVAALAVLLPAAAYGQGQDIPAEDPVFPVPLGHDRYENGGFFASAEFLFWRQTNPLHDQQLAVRGVLDQDGSISHALGGDGIPGEFFGSRATALKANDAGGPGSYQPGFRITAGWLFSNGIQVEASWIHLFEAKYSAVASVEPAFGRSGPFLEETFLTSFVFNLPPEFAGPSQKVNIGNPGATYGIYDASTTQSIEFTQRFDQYEITGRFPLFGDDCNRTYWLLGPRIAWIWERFKWRTVAVDITTNVAGQDDVAIYSNIVSNRMYGIHLGAGYEWYRGSTPIGAFAVSVEGDCAAFADMVKEQAKYERGDFAIANQRSRDDYTAAAELSARLNLWWYPVQAVQMRVGYDFNVFFNTVSSPDPVSFNYGSLDPPWRKGTTRVLEGLSAGVGLVF